MIVKVKGVEYDLPLNGLDINITKTVDSTFDSCYVETIPLPANYVSGLDLSRRLPRLADVTFEHDGKTYSMMIAEPNIEKIDFGVGTYIHKLSLVSYTKDLTNYPLENITLTQPKGNAGIYNISVNVAEDIVLSKTNELEIVNYNNIMNTNLSVLNELQVLRKDEFTLVLDTSFSYMPMAINQTVNIRIKYNGSIIHSDVQIIKAVFGFTRKEINKFITIKYIPEVLSSFSVEYEFNTSLDDEITVERTSFTITSHEFNEMPFTMYSQLADKILRKTPYVLSDNARAKLNTIAPEDKYEGYTVYDALSKIAEQNGALVTVRDSVDERILNISSEYAYDNATVKYTLQGSVANINLYNYPIGTVFRQEYNGTILQWVADGSFSVTQGTKIPGTTCYVEGETATSKLKSGTVYQNLICTAVDPEEPVYLYYIIALSGNLAKGVDFLFFDNPRVIDLPNITDEQATGELEDYVNALELNTKNVIDRVRHSPHKNGFGLLTSGSIDRITISNITYETEDDIEVITSVLVRGLASQSANYVWLAGDITDITDRVVEDKYYDTLPSDSDYTYTGKQTLKKNNVLYYSKGDNQIKGMSFTGEHKKQLIGEPSVVRALYETILAKRSMEVGELVTRTGTQSQDDPGLGYDLDEQAPGDLQIEIYVQYKALTETHARVYKDDQTGFERQRVKYLNESSNVNESDAIGNYAQVLVNRMGGTKYTISGWANSVDELPEPGDKDSQGRYYVAMTYTLKSDMVTYSAVLVQDYHVLSSYIGINSRHRIEEVTSEDTTLRVLRYTSKLVIVEEETPYDTRLQNANKFFDVLSGGSKTPVTYGYMECLHQNGFTRKLHLSLDTDNKGKTIEIKYKMKDNYSAGLQRYSKVIGGQTVYFNKDVSYTDYYGRVDSVMFKGYTGNYAFTDTERRLYPEATASKGFDDLFTISDIVNKDTREILSGLVELPVMSEHPKVNVYNGFARYNTVVDNDGEIVTGLLLYTPQKNAVKVDITRVKQFSITVDTSVEGEIDISFTPDRICHGVVWYDKNSLDLVMTYNETMPSYVAKNITLYTEVRDD